MDFLADFNQFMSEVVNSCLKRERLVVSITIRILDLAPVDYMESTSILNPPTLVAPFLVILVFAFWLWSIRQRSWFSCHSEFDKFVWRS